MIGAFQKHIPTKSGPNSEMNPLPSPPNAARKSPALLTLGILLAALAPTASAQAATDTAPQPAKYAVEPEFRLLRFGEVMPKGWIREQFIRDLDVGFAGHMPEVAPMTCGALIFGINRNTPDHIQNAGGGSWGGAEGAWWKGETEGNWRSGSTMMALMTGLPEKRAEADAKVDYLLKTQDADGYMGIYGPTIRWAGGEVDNGELWTQTCIFRGLLAYYEATGRPEVLRAVERAAQLTMGHYGPGIKDPYGAETQNHNLMFVDVMERLYDLTGNPAYRDFGVYLYRDYSKDMTTDIALGTLLAADHPFVGHGATTYEGLRVPIWAAYVTGDPMLRAAADEALAKSWAHVSPTGGPVSDEFINNKPTDPNLGGYEGCGEKEWMTSLLSAAQKTGRASLAEQAETTYYNSTQGSRLPDGTGVDYVTTDNIYRIEGAIMNRVIFSPAHEDVANCCAPNFTQIGPVFVRSMWMRAPDGLAAVMYGPCDVHTTIGDTGVRIGEDTSYPFSDRMQIRVDPDAPVDFLLRLRIPSWTTGISATCAGADIRRAGDWLLVSKKWKAGDTVDISFGATTQPVPSSNGEYYVRRGPLFYAMPIAATKRAVKDYPLKGFHDYLVFPVEWAQGHYALPSSGAPGSYELTQNKAADPRYPWDTSPVRLEAKVLNLSTNKTETLALVPMGSGEAILRRMTFPLAQ
jgi:uncharacterized protein